VHHRDPVDLTRRTVGALAAGLTARQLRGSGYVHPAHGLVRPAGVEADAVTLQLADVLALLTADSFVGGWASLHLQGNTWFDGLDANGELRPVLVHCLPGSQLRRRSGLVLPFRGLVHPDESIDLGGFRVSTMARAAFDEMRMAVGVRSAVVAADMAASTTHQLPHTSVSEVGRVLKSHHKVRGLVMARRAHALSSSRSASPLETRTRLLAQLDAGLPGLGVNVPVFDEHERLLGVADLLDEEAGLVIETDGEGHREQTQHTMDNRREEGFERAGLVVCRVTALDHRERWDTVGRIAAARRDAVSSGRRAWTTQKPDWWFSWKPGRRWD
jgi:hypothetical protein